VNFLIHEELTRRRIEIPFPQRDLRIRSAKGLERLWAGAGRAAGTGTDDAVGQTGRDMDRNERQGGDRSELETAPEKLGGETRR